MFFVVGVEFYDAWTMNLDVAVALAKAPYTRKRFPAFLYCFGALKSLSRKVRIPFTSFQQIYYV